MPSKYKPKEPSEIHCEGCGEKFLTTRKAVFCKKDECQKKRHEKNMRNFIERRYREFNGQLQQEVNNGLDTAGSRKV